MKIICISGKAGSGKDTTAKILKDVLENNASENRVLITHYADLLKFILREWFQWDGKKDEAGRTLIQHIGTDVIRKQNPDFWVNFIASMLKFFPVTWDYVLIPDARFENEISKLREYEFDVTHIRITRENLQSQLSVEQMGHQSETALDHVRPDFEILNNGSLNELRTTVSRWANEQIGYVQMSLF